ncbi:MAG: S-layer homology domain-containing protein [Dehalobacterium sp.]
MKQPGCENHYPQFITKIRINIAAETSSFSKYALVEKVRTEKTFTDITHHWAKNDIELMSTKGIVHGITPDQFAPDALVTRAESAAMLVNALGISGGTGNFKIIKQHNAT